MAPPSQTTTTGTSTPASRRKRGLTDNVDNDREKKVSVPSYNQQEHKHQRNDDDHNDQQNKRQRKRRSTQLQQYGVDLPDIPGIPVQIIPLHVNAIKATVKFFRHISQLKTYSAIFPSCNDDESSSKTSGASSFHEFEAVSDHEFPEQRIKSEKDSKKPSQSVIESILKRIDDTVLQQDQTLNENLKIKNNLHSVKNDAIRSWLDAIQRWIRDHHHNEQTLKRTIQVEDKQGSSKFSSTEQSFKSNVTISVLEHLLELAMEHNSKTITETATKTISIRRAATHCLGILVQKSADCRKHLFDDDNEYNVDRGMDSPSQRILIKWMDSVIETPNFGPRHTSRGSSDGSNDKNMIHHLLLQYESYLILHCLQTNGYGDLYSTIPVAVQRFEQFCPSVCTMMMQTTDDDNYTDKYSHNLYTRLELRRIRDIAMDYYEKEVQFVNKLIDRANVCIDVLVPRVGEPEEQKQSSFVQDVTFDSTTNHIDKNDHNKNDDDDDDDDASIDWVDGLESSTDDMWLVQEQNKNDFDETKVSHIDAVNHTIAVMESTGGLTNGGIEIDFSKPADNRNNNSGFVALSSAGMAAQKRLVKVVRILAERHLPRLSEWVDGLSKADNLVVKQTEASSLATTTTTAATTTRSQRSVVLVTLSSSQIQRRKDAYDALFELKQNLATVLKVSRRLVTMNDDVSKNNAEHLATIAGSTTDRRSPNEQHTSISNTATSTRPSLLPTGINRTVGRYHYQQTVPRIKNSSFKRVTIKYKTKR